MKNVMITVLLSLFLVACGDNAEKKVETKAAEEVNQTQTQTPEDTTTTTTSPDQSKLEDSNREVNDNLSSAATSSANEQVAENDNSDSLTVAASQAASETVSA